MSSTCKAYQAKKLIISYFQPRYRILLTKQSGEEEVALKLGEIYDKIESGTCEIGNLCLERIKETARHSIYCGMDIIREDGYIYRIKIDTEVLIPKNKDSEYIEYCSEGKERYREYLAKLNIIKPDSDILSKIKQYDKEYKEVIADLINTCSKQQAEYSLEGKLNRERLVFAREYKDKDFGDWGIAILNLISAIKKEDFTIIEDGEIRDGDNYDEYKEEHSSVIGDTSFWIDAVDVKDRKSGKYSFFVNAKCNKHIDNMNTPEETIMTMKLCKSSLVSVILETELGDRKYNMGHAEVFLSNIVKNHDITYTEMPYGKTEDEVAIKKYGYYDSDEAGIRLLQVVVDGVELHGSINRKFAKAFVKGMIDVSYHNYNKRDGADKLVYSTADSSLFVVEKDMGDLTNIKRVYTYEQWSKDKEILSVIREYLGVVK